MIKEAWRYLKKAPQIVNYFAADPVEVWLRLKAKLIEQPEQNRAPCPYTVHDDWERHLHENLGVPWPCKDVSEFWALWPNVIDSIEAKGLHVGVGFFGGFNDGDTELVRAIWCVTRHLRPKIAVETGVARGVTSRFILEAFDRNGSGVESSEAGWCSCSGRHRFELGVPFFRPGDIW